MTKYGLTEHWSELITTYFDKCDVDTYFTENYVKLYASDSEKAICFYYINDDFCLLFPFLKRTFLFQGQEYHDFETAYGYGGPLWNRDVSEFIEMGLVCFSQLCKREHYVAGFIRFHPLLNNQKHSEIVAQIIPERRTIDIDLHENIEDIWMHEIHTKNRNVIKKGIKSGLVFHLDENFVHLEEFIKLYNHTMNKVSAEDFYYFSKEYYNRFVHLITHSFLAYATFDDKIVAAALFFYSNKLGHYHLAGSDRNYLKISPNNFLLWNVAKEMRTRGIERFHLGGGNNADEKNSLFCFKSRFSKHTNQFYIGKMIFDAETYSNICNVWEQKNPDKAIQYKHHLLKYKY